MHFALRINGEDVTVFFLCLRGEERGHEVSMIGLVLKDSVLSTIIHGYFICRPD